MDKKTVLVVEDEPLNMKLAVDLLESYGFNTLKAVTGEETLTLLKKIIPDLILLDICLPDIDGVEVYQRIRKDRRLDAVPVVAMTAFAEKKITHQLLKASFCCVLEKPFDIKEFVKVIQEKCGDTNL